MTPSEEVRAWCATGLLALCGTPEEPAAPPIGLVDGLIALEKRTVHAAAVLGAELSISWPELVLGRAAMRRFTPKGRTSANGSCRLLATRDVPVALNLPRPDDLAVLDALVEGEVGEDYWSSLEHWAASQSSQEVLDRTALLHLAAGALGEARSDAVVRSQVGERTAPRSLQGLRVVDLTSMWAGPLCANLLAQTGASVLKVEARARPDGARLDERFYAWLHPEDQIDVIVDLGTPTGREELRRMLESADVVLESSRPRALRQLGLDYESLSLRPGMVWAAITARGPLEPMAVGFGDDAAVAGGLVARTMEGEEVFCGDAIADPISGMFAAAEVFESLAAGGGVHLGISMAGCARSVISFDRAAECRAFISRRVDGHLAVEVDGEMIEVLGPRVPVGV